MANLKYEIRSNDATDASVARVDMKIEVVVIPVSDVDRAKEFYGSLGWRLDADRATGADFRVIQYTPPGSACSVQFGTNLTSATPGSAQGLYLIVSDIEAARAELITSRVKVSEVFHEGAQRGARRSVPSRDERSRQRPCARSPQLRLIRLVQRSRRQRLAAPGGHDTAARTGTQHGRRDSDRASARGRAAPWRVRTDRAEAPLVGVVRRLHRRARERQDSRRGSQRCRAPHRRCPRPRAGVEVGMRPDIVPGRPSGRKDELGSPVSHRSLQPHMRSTPARFRTSGPYSGRMFSNVSSHLHSHIELAVTL